MRYQTSDEPDAPPPAGFVRENLSGNPRTSSNKRFTMRGTGSSLEPCAVELSGRSDSWLEEGFRWEP
jgi:hypothetical protein